MRTPPIAWGLACLASLAGAPTYAQAPTAAPISDAMLAAGFMEGHPDLRFRKQGLDAYAEGKYSDALARFRKAAWYGDKASQAIVGEMLWGGRGAERDQVMGLVWMDLAAERGYPRFVNTRNGYWNALSPAERQRARNLADALYDEYGDAVTDPRLAKALRRERSKMTGSRLGSLSSNVQIIVPGHGSIDGSQFYNPRYWDPQQYREWHDTFWQNLREGTVEVGDPEKLDGMKPLQPPPPAQPGTPR